MSSEIVMWFPYGVTFDSIVNNSGCSTIKIQNTTGMLQQLADRLTEILTKQRTGLL